MWTGFSDSIPRKPFTPRALSRYIQKVLDS